MAPELSGGLARGIRKGSGPLSSQEAEPWDSRRGVALSELAPGRLPPASGCPWPPAPIPPLPWAGLCAQCPAMRGQPCCSSPGVGRVVASRTSPTPRRLSAGCARGTGSLDHLRRTSWARALRSPLLLRPSRLFRPRLMKQARLKLSSRHFKKCSGVLGSCLGKSECLASPCNAPELETASG